MDSTPIPWSEASVMPTKRESVQVNRMSDEVVLYDERSRMVHVLNPTARLIWDRCDGSTSVGDLVEEMLATFAGVSRDTLLQDAIHTLSQLTAKGLVARPDSSG